MTLTKLLRMTNTFTKPAFLPLASFQFSRLTKYEIFFYLGKKVRLCLSSNQPCLFVSHLWMLYPKWLNVDLFQVFAKEVSLFVLLEVLAKNPQCGFKIDFVLTENSNSGKNLLIPLILFHNIFLWNFPHKIISVSIYEICGNLTYRR